MPRAHRCLGKLPAVQDVERFRAEPRSLKEELYGRRPELQVFISSKMRDDAFKEERRRIAELLDGQLTLTAWYWERDADAGPYCAEEVCVWQAATSDALILVVGSTLTPTTRLEFEAAVARGVPCMVFIDDRETQDEEVQAFIADLHKRRDPSVITKRFQNLSELLTHVSSGLRRSVSSGVRTSNFRRWEQRR